ncbi:unnamed protein product [Euphydryas editha]|uniref:Uncharacterized protein n=1 Tax=Euphydryas editha TaxID=104508 RepID=A0AAU9TVH7_EUPED|nr:unnamed protein product [Euphydryas editha]
MASVFQTSDVLKHFVRHETLSPNPVGETKSIDKEIYACYLRVCNSRGSKHEHIYHSYDAYDNTVEGMQHSIDCIGSKANLSLRIPSLHRNILQPILSQLVTGKLNVFPMLLKLIMPY